jgi:hypothetical protein
LGSGRGSGSWRGSGSGRGSGSERMERLKKRWCNVLKARNCAVVNPKEDPGTSIAIKKSVLEDGADLVLKRCG